MSLSTLPSMQNSTYFSAAFVGQVDYEEGTIKGPTEKPVGFIIGERIVRPTIDIVARYGKFFFDFLQSFTSSINHAFTFPGAYANSDHNDLVQEEKNRIEQIKKLGERAKNAAKTVKNPSDFYDNMIRPELQEIAEKKLEDLKKKHDAAWDTLEKMKKKN